MLYKEASKNTKTELHYKYLAKSKFSEVLKISTVIVVLLVEYYLKR